MDMFDHLNIDPDEIRKLPVQDILKELRKAYIRVIRYSHPDKAPEKGRETAQQLNAIKDYFNNFETHNFDSEKVLRLVRRGVKAREVRNYAARKKPVPQQTRPGSGPSDPIILDSPEIAPECSTPRPTQEEASGYSHIRSSPRRNPRKNLDGMVMWGDVEYRQQTFKEFCRTWNKTQTMWGKLERLIEATGADSEFGKVLARFKMVMEPTSDRKEVSLTSVFALGRCWKIVKKKLPGREGVWGDFWKSSQTVHELTEQAALYDCILSYPNSRARTKRRKMALRQV